MQAEVWRVRFVKRTEVYRLLGIPDDTVIYKVSYGDAQGTLLDRATFAAFLAPYVESLGITEEQILAVIPDVRWMMVDLES